MTPKSKEIILLSLRGLLIAQCLFLLLPYSIGWWYDHTGPHASEQLWLNKAITHCKQMRAACVDPDLCDILDYTIQRYHRIGGFDVAVMPCFTPDDSDGGYVIGINMPTCPGMCIDPKVLNYPIEIGAMVVVHEAMHDYRPWWGHNHINERERKLYDLSYSVRR